MATGEGREASNFGHDEIVAHNHRKSAPGKIDKPNGITACRVPGEVSGRAVQLRLTMDDASGGDHDADM